MENKLSLVQKYKALGQVYTPKKIVSFMLDSINYNDDISLLEKHIIDNSCGDGSFLCEIVKRYIKIYQSAKNLHSEEELVEKLQLYIHGIEIDISAHKKAIDNLNSVLKEFGIKKKVNWDIINGDALRINKYNGKMDFVVGNPPYIRIHNIKNSREDFKNFKFANSGMFDLYLIFFEIGFNMMNEKGVMSYITPDSFYTSNSASQMRKYIESKKILDSIYDFNHFNPFKGINVYPCITIFSKNRKSDYFTFFRYSKSSGKFKKIHKLRYIDISINDSWFFSSKNQLSYLKEIMSKKFKNKVFVKNGIATLADDIFINNDYFGKHVVDVYKASTGNWSKIFFPYNSDFRVIPEHEIKIANEAIFKIFKKNKNALLKRSIDTNSEWYAFGRSQGIKDIFREKISISTILREKNDIKMAICPPGTLVYSGFYITSDYVKMQDIMKIVMSDDFVKFCKIINIKKNGGFFSLKSKYVENYLNYRLIKYGK